jgi:homoserine O-acetyltransferase
MSKISEKWTHFSGTCSNANRRPLRSKILSAIMVTSAVAHWRLSSSRIAQTKTWLTDMERPARSTSPGRFADSVPSLTQGHAAFYITDTSFAISNKTDQPVTILSHPRAASLLEADAPHSLVVRFDADHPLQMDAGAALRPLTIAYQTYGELNADKSNAILVCHALTGDQHVANTHPVTGKPGWWQVMVGPGRPIDTNRFFVIASNVVGGCMGTTGPASINPATGRAYGLELPIVTIRDMTRAQAMLIDHLGIETLFCVVGGSMGGMQVLQWAASYPQRVFAAMPIATAAKHSSQNIAFHEVGRQAIMADPEWREGRYFDFGVNPTKGLAVARMAAHITYLSEEVLQRKFGRKLQERDAPTFSFDAEFQIENYLRYQGTSFVDRFDANSYLYVTRACDYFDLAADYGGSLSAAFKGSKARFCVISFNSDWLYPTFASRAIVHALNAAGASVSFVDIDTDRGHDAFFLDVPEFIATSRGFLEAAAHARGLPPSGSR